MAGEDVAKEGNDGQVGLPTSGRSDDVNGSGGGGYVCPPPPEYLCPVYSYLVNTGDMSSDGATSRSAGDDEMVGPGRPQLRSGGDR